MRKWFKTIVPHVAEQNQSVLQAAVLGCLWGTAVGDALGLPFEGLSRRRQQRLCPDLNGYHLLTGRGMVSDDTEHTWMAARALLASGGEPKAFGRSLARSLRWWLAGIPAGIGFATLRSALRLWLGVPYTRSGVYSAGNGPAMRAALLGVCWGHDPKRLRELVRVSTRLTHTDPKAETGALLVAVAAHCSVMQATREPHASGLNDTVAHEATSMALSQHCELLRAALPAGGEEWADALDKLRASVLAGETTPDFARAWCGETGVSGYILHTVPVALHAWLRSSQNFERAVLETIRCGGDTDTTAAIVGALVGTAVGTNGIRADWQRKLWLWPYSSTWMTRLSRALTAGSTPGQSVPRINPLAVLMRNVLFAVVIVAHGFRRLLPPYG